MIRGEKGPSPEGNGNRAEYGGTLRVPDASQRESVPFTVLTHYLTRDEAPGWAPLMW